jgi:hypothetical protein
LVNKGKFEYSKKNYKKTVYIPFILWYNSIGGKRLLKRRFFPKEEKNNLT